jgi:hypothetical protein
MISIVDGTGFEKLLEDKSISADHKRRIIATSIALRLISSVVTSNNSAYKLSEEMQNLEKYIDSIEYGLTPKK